MMRTVLASLVGAAILASAFVVTGCNTVQGLGRDVERGGEKIQQEAVEARRK